MNIGLLLNILLYVLAGFYGFIFSFFVLRFLQKFFFSSIKKGKFNSILSIPFMLVCAIVLFLPALINLKYFAVALASAIITNFILLILLSRQLVQKKDDKK